MKKTDKIKGMLYGVALGDAFGMPTEMLSRETIKKNNLDFSEPFESLDYSIISKNRQAYSITDDTMNTLMIMEMLKENNGKVNSTNYLRKLKYWSTNSPIASFVTGPSTSKALKEIEEGKSIEESGKFGTTNGAAMKILPIGLISDYKTPHKLIENVVNICKATHNTNIALSGASIIAAIASYFYQGGNNIDEMYSIIYDFYEKTKYLGFQWPSASLSYRIKQARIIVELYKKGISEDEILDKLYSEIGCSMETIDTIPVAIALFDLSNGNALKCAKLSSMIGGDTDTIGAIATGICGIYKPQTIPIEMIKQIEKVNMINFNDYILE